MHKRPQCGGDVAEVSGLGLRGGVELAQGLRLCVDALPLNATGKVGKDDLRARALGEVGAGLGMWTSGVRALQGLGYRAEAAASLAEARALAASRPFDLLLTDVILPDGNGKALYGELRANRPALRVLYVSGYTDNVIAHHGILEKGIDFLQKPFTANELARALRRVLDRPA
jgi:CheY-like chemotaxis protein